MSFDLADVLTPGEAQVSLTSAAQRLLWIAALAIAVSACASTPHAPAKPKVWDQAAVTSIAHSLPRATGLLVEAIETESRMQQLPASFGISPEDKRFIRDAGAIHHEADRLANDLHAGKGKSETLASFQQIEKLLGDAKAAGKQAFEVEPIYNHFHQVESVARRLAPYYAETPK
jgi:hypothetical protein